MYFFNAEAGVLRERGRVFEICFLLEWGLVREEKKCFCSTKGVFLYNKGFTVFLISFCYYLFENRRFGVFGDFRVGFSLCFPSILFLQLLSEPFFV